MESPIRSSTTPDAKSSPCDRALNGTPSKSRTVSSTSLYLPKTSSNISPTAAKAANLIEKCFKQDLDDMLFDVDMQQFKPAPKDLTVTSAFSRAFFEPLPIRETTISTPHTEDDYDSFEPFRNGREYVALIDPQSPAYEPFVSPPHLYEEISDDVYEDFVSLPHLYDRLILTEN